MLYELPLTALVKKNFLEENYTTNQFCEISLYV